MDAIVKLKPDLVLAPQSGLTQAQFDTLSALAPTAAYPGKPWTTGWSEQIGIIGKALGESQAASGLVDTITKQLARSCTAADGPSSSCCTTSTRRPATPPLWS